jgi:hypothetical protein
MSETPDSFDDVEDTQSIDSVEHDPDFDSDEADDFIEDDIEDDEEDPVEYDEPDESDDEYEDGEPEESDDGEDPYEDDEPDDDAPVVLPTPVKTAAPPNDNAKLWKRAIAVLAVAAAILLGLVLGMNIEGKKDKDRVTTDTTPTTIYDIGYDDPLVIDETTTTVPAETPTTVVATTAPETTTTAPAVTTTTAAPAPTTTIPKCVEGGLIPEGGCVIDSNGSPVPTTAAPKPFYDGEVTADVVSCEADSGGRKVVAKVRTDSDEVQRVKVVLHVNSNGTSVGSTTVEATVPAKGTVEVDGIIKFGRFQVTSCSAEKG